MSGIILVEVTGVAVVRVVGEDTTVGLETGVLARGVTVLPDRLVTGASLRVVNVELPACRAGGW